MIGAEFHDIWTALHRIACVVEQVHFNFDAPRAIPALEPPDFDAIVRDYRRRRRLPAVTRAIELCNTAKKCIEDYWGNVSPWLRSDIGYRTLTSIEIDHDDEGVDLYWEFDDDPNKGFYLVLKSFPDDGLPHRYQIYRRSVLDVDGIANWNECLCGGFAVGTVIVQFFKEVLGIRGEILLDNYSEAQWFRDDLSEDVFDINNMFSQLLAAQSLRNPPPTYKMRQLDETNQRQIWEHTIMQSFLLYYIAHSNHTDQYAVPIIYFQNTRWVLDYDMQFIAHVGGKFCTNGRSGTPGEFILGILEQRTETLRGIEGYSDIQAIVDIPLPTYDQIYELTIANYLKEDGQLGFERSQVHIKTTTVPL